MRFSIISILTTIAFTSFAAADVPPGCLLAAVNTQNDPADVSSICNSSNAPDVQSAIASYCSGNNNNVAQSAFIASCSAAGTKVAPYTATATGGTYIYTTAVYDSACSCTKTVVTSATSGVAGARTTGAGSATRTGANGQGATSTAGANGAFMKRTGGKKVASGGYAAAAIAVVGAVAAL